MGIEPTSEAWEVLDKSLKAIDLAALSFPSETGWKLKTITDCGSLVSAFTRSIEDAGTACLLLLRECPHVRNEVLHLIRCQGLVRRHLPFSTRDRCAQISVTRFLHVLGGEISHLQSLAGRSFALTVWWQRCCDVDHASL
jgi:hypothetical protein